MKFVKGITKSQKKVNICDTRGGETGQNSK